MPKYLGKSDSYQANHLDDVSLETIPRETNAYELNGWDYWNAHQVTIGQFEIVFTSKGVWNISGINSAQPLHHFFVPAVVEVVVSSSDMRFLPSWA